MFSGPPSDGESQAGRLERTINEELHERIRPTSASAYLIAHSSLTLVDGRRRDAGELFGTAN